MAGFQRGNRPSSGIGQPSGRIVQLPHIASLLRPLAGAGHIISRASEKPVRPKRNHFTISQLMTSSPPSAQAPATPQGVVRVSPPPPATVPASEAWPEASSKGTGAQPPPHESDPDDHFEDAASTHKGPGDFAVEEKVEENTNVDTEDAYTLRGPSQGVSKDEFASLSLSGLIPSSQVDPLFNDEVQPVAWEVPPKHCHGSDLNIVGVPATATAIAVNGKITNGYGGLEAMLGFEGLTPEDLDDLEDVIGPGVRKHILQLRRYQRMDPVCLEATLSSVQVRREFALLLVEFEPERLAERTFDMFSFLRRLLVKYRNIREELHRVDSEEFKDAHRSSGRNRCHAPRVDCHVRLLGAPGVQVRSRGS